MKTIKEIENYIQLHTSEMDNDDYILFMRELADWATNQANIIAFREESLAESTEE